MRSILSWAVLLAAILLGQLTAQDRAPTSLIHVTGRVVDADSGAPIPNARVSTSVTGVGYPVVLSDAEGRFSFQMPAALRFIAASKAGFTRREAPATPDVAQEIRLSRAAAISGRITDENGEPLVGVRVSAIRFDPSPTLRSRVASSETNDLGEYRIGGLGTDPLLLATVSLLNMVRDGNGFRLSGDALYYPRTTAVEEATRITLKPGEERAGIDFVFEVAPGFPTGALAMVSAEDGRAMATAAAVGPAGVQMTFAVPRPTAKGTASIRGRVVNSSGSPVPRAEVRLTAAEGGRQIIAQSDADGVFAFADVGAGRYRTTASRSGYFAQPPNAGGPPPTLTVAEAEKIEGLEIVLQRFGLIEGRVVDERGGPVEGAVVQLLNVRYQDGRRSLVETNTARATDDRGYYRLHSLRPGQFIVSVSIGDVSTAELPHYARAYYPGTPDPSLAQYVDVRAGAEIRGIELPLSRVRTARISGTLLDAQGRPTMGGSVKLVPGLSSIVGVSVGARIEPDGDFEFVNVSPGQYVIQVSRARTLNWVEGDFIAWPVGVGESDVTDLVLRALPVSVVTGHITLNPDAKSFPERRSIDIVPVPVDPLMAPEGNLATARVRDDWSFELGGITGIRRLLAVRLPRGWALEAVRVNGMDVTDRPMQFGGDERSLAGVEVVLTDRVSTLSGTVVDARSAPVPGAGVVAFSIDREHWYPSSRFLRRVNSDAAGAFNIQGLPPGTFHVAAVTRLPSDGADAWQDPSYLESLRARASAISIRENQSTAVRLQVAR